MSLDEGRPASTILEDRIQLDLIEQLERTRDTLEKMDTSDIPSAHFQILADNALRAAVEYLVQLREHRLASE
jgi:hypothetical protein